MSLDLKTFGAKVESYRTQLAESMDDVESATGIHAERLLSLEAGSVAPTGDEVLVLADHFSCDYKFFISNERLAPFEQTQSLYRAHEADFTKSDRRVIQDFLYLCETEAFLMSELGRAHIEFSFTPVGTNYRRDAEQAAAALRKTLGFDDRRLLSDVYGEFRRVGVHVFRRQLGNSNISGLFVMHPVAGKCALVNYDEDIYRQRFSAAHEMAHAIFDAEVEASVSFKPATGARDVREQRADYFASCFLMPPSLLARLATVWSDDDVLHWAGQLKVSCHALAIALKKASLINEGELRRFRELRVPRADKVDPELPSGLSSAQRARKEHLLRNGLSDAYVGLCFDGLREGVISLGRLSEALLCSYTELSELASVYGRTLRADH